MVPQASKLVLFYNIFWRDIFFTEIFVFAFGILLSAFEAFCLFWFISSNIFVEKTVDFSGIRTRIVGVKSKDVDH